MLRAGHGGEKAGLCPGQRRVLEVTVRVTL